MTVEQPYAARPPETNGYAIASLVLGIAGLMGLFLVGPILALVFGYSARRTIDESGGAQSGRGFAVAGIVLGWVGVAVTVLAVVIIVLGVAVAVTTGANGVSGG